MFSLFRSCVHSLFLISLLLFWLPAQSQTDQKPAFISDALVVYIHSGPGNQYRIIGTLAAGSSVMRLSEENGYAQIQYDDNKTGWLPRENLSYTPGLRAQYTELQASYTEQSGQLAELEQNTALLQTEINRLTQERDLAQQELQKLNRDNERLMTQLDQSQVSFWQQPMVIGAAVLLFGLMFGMLLPKLIPSRRNSDRWM